MGDAPPPDDPSGPSVQGAVRNAAAMLAAQAGGHGLRAVATVVLLLALTREDYGVLTAAVAFVDPIRSLAALGMDTVALRRAAVAPQRLPVVIGSLLRIRLVLGALAFAVAVAAALSVRSAAAGGPVVVVCAALVIVPAAINGPLETVFQARQRMRRVVAVPAAAAAAYVALLLALWAAGASVAWFVAAAAAGDVVAALLAARLVRGELAGAPLRADAALCREMVREGLPLAFVHVVVVLYQRAGIYLVERTDDLGAVADLGAAIRLTLPLVIVGAAVAVSLTPYTSRVAAERGHRRLAALLPRLVVRAALLAGAAAFLGGWLAEPVVRALRPEYLGAVPAIRWMAFASVWMVVAQLATSALVGLGTFRLIAVLEVVNLAVFLALAVPLVATSGAEGAAAAMAGMQAVNALLQLTAVRRIVRSRGAV